MGVFHNNAPNAEEVQLANATQVFLNFRLGPGKLVFVCEDKGRSQKIKL